MARGKTKGSKSIMGRPSKYKPEYCDLLLKHGKEGYSFETFPAAIYEFDGSLIAPETCYEWATVHEDFSLIKKVFYSLSRRFWEKLSLSGAMGEIDGYSASTVIFLLKSRFGLKDGSEVSKARSSKIEEKWEKLSAKDIIEAMKKDPFVE